MNTAPHRDADLVVWAEILLLPIIGVALAAWLNEATPFTVSRYPWLWLIPLFLGLRYGLAAAAAASFSLAVTSIASHRLGLAGEAPPLIHLVGGAFAALGAGQYSSRWRQQLGAALARTDYTEERLESLTRAFFITRLSHDRLEEALITQPVTLRGAMEALRPLGAESPTGISPAGADALLQLLAHYCRFEAAALHLYRKERLSDEPIAALGPSLPLSRTDPLLVFALEDDQTAYRSVEELEGQTGDYRAVFPVVDAARERLGVLVVRDLPLLALTEENLTVATAILQYFADESWAAAQTADLRHRLPDCPAQFAHELIKLQHLHDRSGVRSTLIVLRARDPQADTFLLEAMYDMRRGLDLYWRSPFGAHTPSMLILLPLAGPATARGFLERIAGLLRAKGVEGGLEAAGFTVVQIAVDHRLPAALLAACGIEQPT
ncbi:MAG: hypothetical protein M0T84_12070 [Betaproteobacteria bacterium]|nr:hypothetical protein [Betaproteobacteria bacterium]